MAQYISLVNFTQQGLQNIHESPHRAAVFKTAAKKVGVKVSHVFWTMGHYDGVILFEAKDPATAASLMLALSGLGNVRTTTLHAFAADEFAALAKGVPAI